MNDDLEIIELFGTNRDCKRVDLILHDGLTDLIVGKVRPLGLAPTQKATVKCFVLIEEMSTYAMSHLKRKQQHSQQANFSAGDFQFSGTVSGMNEGMGGGTWAGGSHKMPLDRTLMFIVSPNLVYVI